MIDYKVPKWTMDFTTIHGKDFATLVSQVGPEWMSVDTETYFNPNNKKAITRFIQGSPNNEPFMFTFTFPDLRTFCVVEGFEYLKEVLERETTRFVNQNMKYDFHMMANIDLPVPEIHDDTMTMIQILDPEHWCNTESGGQKMSKALKNMAYHYLESDGKLRNKIKLNFPHIEGTQWLEDAVDRARAQIAKDRGVKKADVSYKDVYDYDRELMTLYACADTYLVAILWPEFKRIIEEEGQLPAYDMDIRATYWLLNMERRGIRISRERMQRDEALLDSAIAEIEPEILRLAGRSFNINSGRDLVQMLESRFDMKWEWFTESGEPDTTKNTLYKLKEKSGAGPLASLIELVLVYRLATHMRDTYITGIYPLIQNGRIHCDLLLASNDKSEGGTVTGRLSSREPNLQNVPKRGAKINYTIGEEERSLEIYPRSYYIPDEGCVFVRQDGDQQEYRVLGHYSRDQDFMQIIQEGKDVHKGCASMMFNVAYEDVTKEQRDQGKTTNFALVYQLGNLQLASNMGKEFNLELAKLGSRILYSNVPAFTLPPYSDKNGLSACMKFASNDEELEAIGYFFSDEVQEALKFAIAKKKEYFAQFPTMKDFLDDVKKTAKSRGWVKNYFGRKYFFKDPAKESYKAPNYIIQGTCSGCLKDRGCELDDYIEANKKSELTMVLLPIHDEIMSQYHISDLHMIPKTAEILADIPFRVPMTWGVDWGTDFHERIDIEAHEWQTIAGADTH